MIPLGQSTMRHLRMHLLHEGRHTVMVPLYGCGSMLFGVRES